VPRINILTYSKFTAHQYFTFAVIRLVQMMTYQSKSADNY